VEEQLIFYKKNEVVFCDQIVVLKRDASFRESEIIALNLQLEKLKKEKERNQIKIDNFDNASNNFDKLIRSQITDNNKTSLGFISYNVVAPLLTGLFAPLTIDLSGSSLEELKQHEDWVCVDTSNEIKKAFDVLIIEDWVYDCDEDESEEMAEAINTACYVQNRVLVTKPHNKTPYELLHGRLPSIGFMRPFGCLVTILNTLDPLSKFQGKVDEGFLVGYSLCSKAFRVFNSRTRIVQETLHVNFMENKPNVAGFGPAWLFDIDSLSQTINYHPVLAENQSNTHAGDKTENKDKGKSPVVTITGFRDLNAEFKEYNNNSSNGVNAARSSVSTAGA
nr:retrovirus-related Pol polyprotein from transposon TNT 1-94 [Tanacetum cinerariifolium]